MVSCLMVSWMSDWHQVIAEDGLELVILLPPLLNARIIEMWHHAWFMLCWVPRTELRLGGKCFSLLIEPCPPHPPNQLFAVLFCFDPGSHYAYLAGLEFTMCTRLTLNSQKSAYFWLPRAGIKGRCHHTVFTDFFSDIFLKKKIFFSHNIIW